MVKIGSFFKLIRELIISIFLLFLIIGCTEAGMELGLVGKWEGDLHFFDFTYHRKGKITLKINDDDTGSFQYKYTIHETSDSPALGHDIIKSDFDIVKSDSLIKTITFEFEDDSFAETADGSYKYELKNDSLNIYQFCIYGENPDEYKFKELELERE